MDQPLSMAWGLRQVHNGYRDSTCPGAEAEGSQ